MELYVVIREHGISDPDLFCTEVLGVFTKDKVEGFVKLHAQTEDIELGESGWGEKNGAPFFSVEEKPFTVDGEEYMGDVLYRGLSFRVNESPILVHLVS
jgi:hypothetical protein